MIKCILFDFDGVLTIDKTGSTSITNYISQETNISLDTIKLSYYKHNKKLLMGEIIHEDMWDDFCNDVGMQIPYQVLIDSFKNTLLDEKSFYEKEAINSSWSVRELKRQILSEILQQDFTGVCSDRVKNH